MVTGAVAGGTTVRSVKMPEPGVSAYHLYLDEGEAFLAIYGDRAKFVAWPYLLRPVSESAGLENSTFTDVASVYGYPGPLACIGADDDEFLCRAWDAINDLWRRQQVVAVFTRFHPLLENHRWLQRLRTPAPSISQHDCDDAQCGLMEAGQTVSIDLTLTDHENLRDYQKVLRQEIARSRRMGLLTTRDDDWKHLDDFISLYHCTMTRNRASSHYFFSAEDIRRLAAALAPHVHLIVTKLDDEVAAAGVFVEYRGTVQAHLAGSNEHMKSLSPLKVLLDDVRRWARERGNKVFHIGGGRAGKDDSLFAFKARFSSRRHPFYVGRWILDPAAYHALCDQQQLYAQQAGLEAEVSDFFPRYRTRASL